jgi:uracil-DNA glycosylase
MLAAMGVRLFERDEPAAEAVAVAAPPMPPIAAETRVTAIATTTDSDRGDIAAMDWPTLRAAVAACRACALCESRKQTVFGVGHPNARLMIVGEAPGEQEDLQGEPFVGQAGKLLDNMLRAIGLTREEGEAEQQVFIANTLKCRPPRNRNPDPAETARCAPFLARQIELVQPRVLLAMGRFAAQSLLATDEPIGRLRGRVHRWREIPVVVTYHPAYLLRTLADKARAWDDLCLAASVLAK